MDVDGDGHIDLITSSSEGVTWHANQNGMGFETSGLIYHQPGLLQLADLDSDGLVDLLLIVPSNSDLLWLRKLGPSGGFDAARRIGEAATSRVGVGDVNGDGHTDVVATIANQSRAVWYENSGRDTFESWHVIDPQVQSASLVSVGDIDGDGDLDIAAAAYRADGHVMWYANEDGKGSFGSRIEIDEISGRRADDLELGDFDADGELDLVVTSGHALSRYEYTNRTNRFVLRGSVAAHGGTLIPSDVDGDGDVDLVGSYDFKYDIDSRPEYRTGWYENTDGTFSTFNHIPGVGPSSGHLAVDDFDADGNMDVVVPGKRIGRLEWVRNPHNDLSQAEVEYIFFSAVDASDSQLADIDNDGDNDLVVSLFEQKMIAVYWGDGNGRFSEPATITRVLAPVRIAIGDLDGDGDLDIASAGYGGGDYGGNLVWYENLGIQAFGPEQEIENFRAGQPHNLDLLDLDRDGDVDVLMQRGDALYWLANSNARFVEPILIEERVLEPYAYPPGRHPLVDLDGDGQRDLVTYDPRSGRPILVWYQNVGGESGFGKKIVIDGGDSLVAGQLTAADFDGDGDLDIATASHVAIHWYENLDAGAFAPARLIRQLDQVRFDGFVAADFDADGDVDLFYSDEAGELILLANQDGLGAFRETNTSPIGNFGAPKLTVADMDGDGDADLLQVPSTSVWNQTANGAITWYEQRVIGDVNNDRRFDTSDVVAVFSAGHYEDEITGNSAFDEGDWNQDGDFDSGDLVFAFQTGNYEMAAEALASPIAAAVELIFTADDETKKPRTFVA